MNLLRALFERLCKYFYIYENQFRIFLNTYNSIRQSIKESLEKRESILPVDLPKFLKYSLIEQEVGFIQFHNPLSTPLSPDLSIERDSILFLFVMEGECTLRSSLEPGNLLLDPSNYLVLSYPYKDWNLLITIEGGTKILLLCISIRKLHEYISKQLPSNQTEISESLRNYKVKNFYTSRKVIPAISVTIHQVFNNTLKESFQKLYHVSKVMELLSYYLDSSYQNVKYDSKCPFLSDNFEIEKIKDAQKIITENMMDPPTLAELARAVGTNEYKLKVGFKKLFGNTVYGHLNDYRMDKSRELLEIDGHQIKEVAYRVGYSNPSHFITAFKKKFGVTPKKYLKSVQN